MKKNALALAVALPFAASPALAADVDSGFYAGVGGGIFSVDAGSIEDEDVAISFDEDDTGFRVFGGWQFNQTFGIEGGYVDGGSASASFGDFVVDGFEADVDIDVTGLDVFGTATLPIGDTFYAYGKLGMIFWDADFSLSALIDDGEGGVEVSESASDSGEDLAYGAGFGMNIGDNAGVQVEYVIYDVDGADVDFASLNFRWRF